MQRAPASRLGLLLREWRAQRGLSQQALADTADVSARHVSFLETGRAQASREMILRLAEALELPLRERNLFLEAAGFAAHFPQHRLADAAVAPVLRALERWLEVHEPFPAFVLDRGYDVVLANRSHEALLAALLPEHADDPRVRNVYRLVLDPELLRPRVRNWPVVAHVLGHRLRRQLRLAESSPALRAHLAGLLRLPGVLEAMDGAVPDPGAEVVLPLELETPLGLLRWFSAIATLGTPRDVTLDELQVETLFPVDASTETVVRAWFTSTIPPR